ncbi:MAG: DsbA family protein [Polyangiales bacterium]
MNRLRFEYWSDPLCIWAFVAQPKLAHLVEAWGPHLDIAYRIVPVFGSVPQRFREGDWAAKGPAGKRDVTREVAERFGRKDVSGEVWVADPPASSWASGAAAKAAFLLEARGEAEPGAGARYLWALREAFLLENRNVARRDVAIDVARSAGLPVSSFERILDDGSALAALFEDDEARKASNVRGSPTYVFDGGRAILYGNFPAAILNATVEELLRGLGVGASSC